MNKTRTYRVLRATSITELEAEINKYLSNPDTWSDLQFHGGMGMEYWESVHDNLEVYRYHQSISFILS